MKTSGGVDLSRPSRALAAHADRLRRSGVFDPNFRSDTALTLHVDKLSQSGSMDICPVSIVALADLAGNFAPLRDYTEAVDTGATGGARFHLTPDGILFPKDARVPDPGFRIPRVGEKLNLALANR